jgi:SAM-dependent methyltransferase
MSFPHDDKAWAETAEFLRGHLAPADRLLAPDPFRYVIPRAQRLRQAAGMSPSDVEWIAVHKGEMAEVPRDFLFALATGATPVFANAVFVVFTADPPADLPSLAEADHVRAFHAKLAELPDAPVAIAPTRGGRVTTIRLPGDAAALPAPTPRPQPKPRHDPRDAAPRPWLSPAGLPGVQRERAFQEELDRLVADSIGPATGQAVLDIGCGGGRLATLLTEAAQVTGIDIDDAALARARQRHAGLPQFGFVRMDAARLGFADASFDTVVILDSLDSFADPAAALAEAARVLAQDGRLMVTATNRDSLPLRAMRRLALPLPKRGHSVQELTAMLRAVGLHVVRSDGLLLSPGWALPGIGGAMGPLEEDPEFVEAARVLGRRAGPEYAMAFSLVARKG